MKQIVVVIFFLGGFSCLMAQTKNDSCMLNGKLNYKWRDYMKFMQKEHFGQCYGMSYDRINFLNNDKIEDKGGFKFNTKLMYFPLVIDINSSYHWFKSPLGIPIYHSNDYRLRFFVNSVALSVCPLPSLPYRWKISKLSEIIVPYGGIGFQWMQIDIKKFHESMFHIFSFTWKVGCYIFLYKIPFAVIIEYERSINKNKLTHTECLNVGLVFSYRHIKPRNNTPKTFFHNNPRFLK